MSKEATAAILELYTKEAKHSHSHQKTVLRRNSLAFPLYQACNEERRSHQCALAKPLLHLRHIYFLTGFHLGLPISPSGEGDWKGSDYIPGFIHRKRSRECTG